MKPFLTAILFTCSLLLVKPGYSQIAHDKTVKSEPWNAWWVAPDHESGREYGVYYFRKSIDLAAKPSNFMVKVSADNRYKLYVNGTLVSVGACTGRFVLLEL